MTDSDKPSLEELEMQFKKKLGREYIKLVLTVLISVLCMWIVLDALAYLSDKGVKNIVNQMWCGQAPSCDCIQ